MFAESSRYRVDCTDGPGTLQGCRSEFFGYSGGTGRPVPCAGGGNADVPNDNRALPDYPALRIALTCLLMLGLVLAFPVQAHALDMPEEVQNVLDEAPISASAFSQMNLFQLLSGLLDQWKAQLRQPVQLLSHGVVFLLVGAAVSLLAPSEQWREMLETVILAGAFIMFSQPIFDLMGQVTQAIQDWYTYLVGFVPVLSGVMLSCGQGGSAMIYSGMFLTMANFSAQIVHTAAMPLLQIYLALSAAAGLCGVDGLQDGCEMLGKAVRWILKFVSTLFGTVLGLQTILAHSADNLAFKAGRFVVSSTIPVVGTAASDAMGSVVSALKVLKGSLGFAAVAVLAAAFLPLLLRCIAYACTVGMCAALAKACGFERGGEALKGMAQSVSLCISFLVFFFMLVVLATALMILTGTGG